MSRKLRKAIDVGDVDLVRSVLNDDPAQASGLISWGLLLCRCKTEPLHYLSDAPFNRLWNHGKQAILAKLLIEAGAPVDGLPTSGETPLHGAASLGETGVAEVLIDHGANLEVVANYPSVPDGTPLDFAVHFGMVEVIDLFVSHGAKVLSVRMAAGIGDLVHVQTGMELLLRNSKQLHEILRSAAVCDRVEVVEYLLSTIDVNADIGGATALHWAAWEAKPRMVAFLMQRGADSTVLDRKHKLTSLGWAIHRRNELGPRWGHDDVIRILDTA